MTTRGNILGGLTAGFVVLVGGILLAGVALAGRFPVPEAAMDGGAVVFILHTLTRFLVGGAAFAVYRLAACAGITRPSPHVTAVLVSFALAYVPGFILLYDYSGISIEVLLIAAPWGMAEIALALTTGRWVSERVG